MTPLLTINIVTHNCLPETQRCIDCLFANTDVPFVLQIADNGSEPGMIAYLQSVASARPNVRLFLSDRNEGFILRQNALARTVQTPFICILNNDVEVGCDWIAPLLAALESDSGLAQVGPSGPSLPIGLDGQWSGRTEYIEGWCIFMRTELAKQFGPFDTRYQFAYFEDTDLSLRLQEFGYRIASVSAPLIHHRSRTRRIVREDVDGYEARNRLVFEARWRYYLKRRSFRYRCKIIRHGAHGDVLCLSPALSALRRRWKQAFISVETRCPEMLLGHPDVDQLFLPGDATPLDEWDIVWRLDGASECRQTLSLTDAFCEALGVRREPGDVPQFFVSEHDRNRARSLIPNEPFAVLHVGLTWPTKMWSLDSFRKFGLRLQEDFGLRIVEVGDDRTPPLWLDYDLRGRTGWKELGAVMERATVFIGIDSGPAHIAQALGTPAVLLFGPTSPARVLHGAASGTPSRVLPILASRLACLGCYDVHPIGAEFAYCPRGDHKCMTEITPDIVLDAVQRLVSGEEVPYKWMFQ